MASGLLRVQGTLDLAQFWPQGESDADTTKVIVDVLADAFKFRAQGDPNFGVTHAFDSATVKGSTGPKPAIRAGKVTVRLQGIDAPELHYPVTPVIKGLTPEQKEAFRPWRRKEYRQYLGETATDALGTKLRGSNNTGKVAATVESRVSQPGDVFDTYGRLVGDVIVSGLNINHWLVEQGWAFPAFYSSMEADEIDALTNLASAAKKARAGVWKYFVRRVRPSDFDRNLVYRGKAVALDPDTDRGTVLLPKLFRRLSAWTASKSTKLISQTLYAHLAAQQSDTLHKTDEYLEQGPHAAPIYQLADFIDKNGKVSKEPAELVFREKPSRVVGPDGKSVQW